jgi:hypothetical protein
MGIFSADPATGRKGLAQGQVFERGTYLTANPGGGAYDLEIVKCIGKGTRKAGQAFIVEFRVLAARDLAPTDFGQMAASVRHPVGSKATWFQKLSDADIAHGAIKEFLYAVGGFDDYRVAAAAMDSTIEETGDLAVSPQNILAGKRVHVETQSVKTQVGKDFTRHTWSPFRK